MKAVGKHFAKVAAKAYDRHGTAWAGLLSDWPVIIGHPLSDFCALEKVSWPKQPENQLPVGSALSRHQKTGGTMIIKAAYGRALEVQHMTPQIIDRINAYYGYGAIAQIKIIQGKVEFKEKPERRKLSPLDQDRRETLDNQMTGIENENLKSALHNLAKGVLADKIEKNDKTLPNNTKP